MVRDVGPMASYWLLRQWAVQATVCTASLAGWMASTASQCVSASLYRDQLSRASPGTAHSPPASYKATLQCSQPSHHTNHPPSIPISRTSPAPTQPNTISSIPPTTLPLLIYLHLNHQYPDLHLNTFFTQNAGLENIIAPACVAPRNFVIFPFQHDFKLDLN